MCRLWRAVASVRRIHSATVTRNSAARPDRPDVLASQVITVSPACPDLPANGENRAFHHRRTRDLPRIVAVALTARLARPVSAVSLAILDSLATMDSLVILADLATLASKDLLVLPVILEHLVRAAPPANPAKMAHAAAKANQAHLDHPAHAETMADLDRQATPATWDSQDDLASRAHPVKLDHQASQATKARQAPMVPLARTRSTARAQHAPTSRKTTQQQCDRLRTTQSAFQ